MKSRWLLLSLFSVFISLPCVLATEPYPIPPSQMPPAVRPTGPATLFVPRPIVPDPEGPLTLDRLKRAGLSSPVYDAFYRTLTHTSAPDSIGVTSSKRGTSHRLRIETNASITDGLKATNDTLQDAESAVTAINLSGTVYTVAASNHYTTDQFNVQHNFINVVRSSTFIAGGFTQPFQLPIPTDQRGSLEFQDSTDPLFASNPQTGGIAPGRIYCTGVLFTPTPQENVSMIGLWHSDDGGLTWSQPTAVAEQSGGGYLEDKPAVTVSQYPSTLGYVFVTWVTADFNAGNGDSIWVAESTDGGLTFQPAVNLTYDTVTGPQVAVDPATGTVYAIWVDNTNHEILAASSPGTGTPSFANYQVVSSSNIVPLGETVSPGVKAATIPMAKFNWQAGRLGVVWHSGTVGLNNYVTNTNIYYAYYPCTSNCNYWGWGLAQVNDSSVNDRFQPSLDYLNGNVIVGWYDRRDSDTGNLTYYQYFGYLTSDGTPIQGNFKASTTASNPTYHTISTGDADFIGDYHEVWTFAYPEGTRAVDSWIFIQDSTIIGDIYLSKLAP